MDVRFNELTVGGKSSYDFDIFLSGAGTYVSPKRKYRKIEVPGRTGDLIIDEDSYENVDLPYKCITHNGIQGYEELRSYLTSLVGYQRIEDSFHPDEYRLGVLKEDIDPKIRGIDYNTASFELVFDCKAQRFLKDGENTIVIYDNGVIYNETLFATKPLIKVYNPGTYTINDKTFTISGISLHAYIDCDIMDVYRIWPNGSIQNANGTFSGDFPILSPGENTISGVGQIEIVPRWFTI